MDRQQIRDMLHLIDSSKHSLNLKKEKQWTKEEVP